MFFQRLLVTIFILLICVAPAAADVLFSQGFENRPIKPVYPIKNGKYQLTTGPAQSHLQWLLDQLAQQDTSLADINAHFSANWLSQVSAQATRDFIAAIRNSYPNGIVVDPVSITPIDITVVIQSPNQGSGLGWVTLKTTYPNGGLINGLGVTSLGGLMYAEDTTLSMPQAADKFQTFSADGALLVARINSQGQCTVVESRLGSELRATASVYKLWVMGGVANAVMAGSITPEQLIPLKASEVVASSPLASVPLGSEFTVSDMSNLMLGISDNTATDHLHDLAGRPVINQFVTDSGVENPTVLQPVLSINEQFHLFSSFSEVDALSYVNGTEPFQNTFLNDQIVPLGPDITYEYFNINLLTDGSWQASPMDVCHAFGALRNLPEGSDALQMADVALSAGTAQPYVRPKWDRVWYKGGGLGSNLGNHVYNHAWMLENEGQDAYAVIAFSNDPNGGIDAFKIQSVTARILELVALSAAP